MMAMCQRQIRGLTIFSNKDYITQLNDDLFTVKSQSGSGTYQVDYDGKNWKCNCPDFIKREMDCKHIYAAKFFHEVQEGTKPKKRYEQKWTEYNKAQIEEIDLFDKLLRELVSTVPEPNQHMGRPRLSFQDQLFCAGSEGLQSTIK